MHVITVKVEDDNELDELAQSAARLLGVDVRKVNNSILIRTSLRVLSAYVSAVEKNVEPGRLKTFLICFASGYGWFKNYNWEQSKQQATKQKIGEQIVDEMIRIFREEAIEVEVEQEEAVS